MDDPFQELGLQRQFAIDESAVRRLQLSLLARWHPDRHPEGVAREAAQLRCSRINAAAKTVLDPVERAQAILDILHASSEAPSLSQEQLLELLERREWALEAPWSEVEAWVSQEVRATVTAIASALDEPERDVPTARISVAYLRALQRLRTEAKRIHDERSENTQ